MKRFFKIMSLAPISIRYKLTVAFALMSVIPMLVCGYFIIYYIFPETNTLWDVSLIFIITIFLMLTGFSLAKKIIHPVIEITAQAKDIVEGTFDKGPDIKEEDEIGELSHSLNRLSKKLKENMGELHSYGEKIKQINMEINKKVFALSGLLQIGNVITTNADLDEVLNLIVMKLSQLEAGAEAFIMFLEEGTGNLVMRAQANMKFEPEREVRVKVGQGLLGQVFNNARPLIIDRNNKPKVTDEYLKNIVRTKNIAVLPITFSGKCIGILGIGNNVEDFIFSDEQMELIGIFAKQVAIAVENSLLMRKTEELAVRDELTMLYNENYIRNRLAEEIKRAIIYQRPCSFIIFDVDNFEQYRKTYGEIAAEKVLRKVAKTLKEGTTEVDKVARFNDHQFAIVLPEKNRHLSLNLAENIRKEIERHVLERDRLLKSSIPLTLSGGISAAPIDGTTAVELINKALHCVEKAKNEGQNRIVVS